jgi:hypothetical protein
LAEEPILKNLPLRLYYLVLGSFGFFEFHEP